MTVNSVLPDAQSVARGLVPRSPAENLLEVRGLKVQRGGRCILEVPSLIVRRGEVLAIIGPNGSGKSTLLQTMGLLLRPDQGEIVFDGTKIGRRANLVSFRRRIAMVFQEPLLLDTSVFENVASGLKLRGVGRNARKARVTKWLERFNIAALASRAAHNLSGGEAQRVSLARAFVLDPDLLLLDEPFSALDPPTRLALLEDLQALLRETGITTVFVTHDRAEALALGDRLGVMAGGQILDLDSPDRVFTAPATPEVAAFVGVENILPGQVAEAGDGLALVTVGRQMVQVVAELEIGQPVHLCLRPEEVTLSLPSGVPSASSARNSFPGVVTKQVPLGSQWRVTVDCGFPLLTTITRRSGLEMNLQPGTTVISSFKASAVHVIRR